MKENEKIEILYKHNATGLYGENSVEGVRLAKHSGEENEEYYDLPADGFLLAIRHAPNSSVFKDFLETNQAGYIRTILDMPKTKIPGVYTAGGVADPAYRQAVVTAGIGCQTAPRVERHPTEINK